MILCFVLGWTWSLSMSDVVSCFAVIAKGIEDRLFKDAWKPVCCGL